MEQNNYNVEIQNNLQEAQTNSKLEKIIDDAFSKALASAIMANFPIASIIAIVFGIKSLKLIDEADALAAMYGINPSGKRIAAKILGTIGKIAGIVMTAIYGALFLFYVVFFIFFIGIYVLAAVSAIMF